MNALDTTNPPFFLQAHPRCGGARITAFGLNVEAPSFTFPALCSNVFASQRRERAPAPAKALFRQSDVTRAIKGVLGAGLPVSRAEIDEAGKIVVLIGEAEAEESNITPLEAWKAKRNAR